MLPAWPSAEAKNALRLDLVRLAKQYGRYGYRMIAELLRAEGWHLNHKKVERLNGEIFYSLREAQIIIEEWRNTG